MIAVSRHGLPAEAMTSTDAAEVLGVTVRQVQRLANSGQLVERGVVGRTILLDTESVLRLAQAGVARGRKWGATTVWIALTLLTAHDAATDDVADRDVFEQRLLTAGLRLPDASRVWHLQTRLRDMSALELVRIARGRARVSRWRVSASYAEQLRGQLVLSGTDAIAHSRDIADRFGLAGGAEVSVDGYLTAEELPKLQRKFFLAPEVGGNATLRTLPVGMTRAAAGDAPAGRSEAIATSAVIALDLAESLDPRQRAAGLRVLGELITSL